MSFCFRIPGSERLSKFFMAIVLFFPTLIHDLFVQPDEEDLGRHLMIWEFGQAFRHLPRLLSSLAFKTRTLEEQLHQSMLKGNLRRSFTLFDLIMIGTGLVVGSGVLIVTGEVQGQIAGSATFLGYALIGIPLLAAAACYAEFSNEYPVAGSAFTYALATLGEYPAAIALGFLIIYYVLGEGAVARGLVAYFGLMCNVPLSDLIVEVNGVTLDFLALTFVLIMTVALCFGMKESSLFLTCANITALFFFIFTGIAAFAKSRADYFTDDFLPNGADGLFQSFAILAFSYTGFDAICNAVEEARDIRDTPKAIMSTVGISGAIYIFLSLSLSFLVTVQELQACSDTVTGNPVPCSAPGSARAYEDAFVYGFTLRGLGWMQYIVALAGVFAISTTLLVGLYSGARTLMVGAREWMLPPIMSDISAKTQTPLVAQIIMGIAAGVFALFISYGDLAQLASFIYLATLWLVCNAFLARRYYPDIKLKYTQYGTVEATPGRFQNFGLGKIQHKMTKKTHRLLVWAHILLINGVSIGCGIFYRFTRRLDSIYFVVAWFVLTLSMLILCPLEYEPTSWKVPSILLPWVPSFAILAIIFVCSDLPDFVYTYSLCFFIGVSLVYIFFSLPLSYVRRFTSSRNTDDTRVVELVFNNGKWVSVDVLMSQSSGNSLTERGSGDLHSIHSFPTSILQSHRSYSKTSSHLWPESSMDRTESSPHRTPTSAAEFMSPLETITDKSLATDDTEHT
mmetsp:Transcript_3310/g.6635  ORF Transcript_3310/g.6635 Transcript_3310/m.6635 type:complete len:737 (-) Transcript_3310:731-2941(-)